MTMTLQDIKRQKDELVRKLKQTQGYKSYLNDPTRGRWDNVLGRSIEQGNILELYDFMVWSMQCLKTWTPEQKPAALEIWKLLGQYKNLIRALKMYGDPEFPGYYLDRVDKLFKELKNTHFYKFYDFTNLNTDEDVFGGTLAKAIRDDDIENVVDAAIECARELKYYRNNKNARELKDQIQEVIKVLNKHKFMLNMK